MAKKVDTLEDLFNWNPPRLVADTSLDAFEEIKLKAGDYHVKIMAYIDTKGESGATLDETCAALNILVQTGSARFRELVQMLEIEDSGMRRKTRSGKNARVYKRKKTERFPSPYDKPLKVSA